MTDVIDAYRDELTGGPQFARMISPGSDARSVCSDSSMNLYMAGVAGGSNTTKNIIDQSNVTLATFFSSAFLSKFDSSGIYQYSIGINSASSTNYIFSSNTDPTDNVYIAGQYGSTLSNIVSHSSSNISVNVASLTATSGSGSTAIASKFDSAGIYQYSRIVDTSNQDDTAYSVSTDSSSNMYFTGYYSGTPQIKGSSNSNVTTIIGTLPAASGTSTSYCIKFNSSGIYQYSRVLEPGGGGFSRAYSTDTDSSDNMYFSGTYIATAAPIIKYVNSSNVSTSVATIPASLGGSNRTSFVSKFNSSGTYLYSIVVDSTGSDYGYSVTTDSSLNTYIAGSYQSTPTIKYVNSSNVSTSVATLPAATGSDSFVSKFNSTGTYIYSIVVDSGNNNGYSVTTDSSDNIFIAGSYTGTPTIKYVNTSNVSTSVATLPAATSIAAFVSKFNSSGTYIYSIVVDSSNDDIGYSVTTDSFGNMYLAGNYRETPTIKYVNTSNVSTSVATLPAAGSTNIYPFVIKFDPDGNYAP